MSADPTIITFSIPIDHAVKLRRLAEDAGVTAEELLRARVEEWLAEPEEQFRQAAAYVLRKNAELYQRLAQPHALPEPRQSMAGPAK